MLTIFANAGEVRTKIDARTTELTSEWNSEDYEGVAAMYDKGFRIVAESSEPMRDRDVFLRELASKVKDYPNVKYETTSLKVRGDYAYEIGVDTYTIKGEDGDAAIGKDDYLLVRKKDDKGAWNCHLDIYWGWKSDE